MKEHCRGFTLAELLIVVAIIAVLVAISIPLFTKQIEKSRESVDAANIRSQYAEVMAEAITNGADVDFAMFISLMEDNEEGEEKEKHE